MYNRLAVGAVAALMLGAMSIGAASTSAVGATTAATRHTVNVTSHGQAATITLRGGWRLAHVKLPDVALPHLRTAGATTTTGDWSGYADTGHNVAFRFIAANFTAPNVNCAASTRGKSGEALATNWVGLDGSNSDTIEQAGFEEECTSSTAQSYFAWYEMFPGAQVAITGAKPGDALSASVYFNSATGKYTLAVTDLTQGGAGFSVNESCPSGSTCSNSSAEAITAVPGGGVAGGYDLADFGAMAYTNAAVTSRSGERGTLGSNSLWSATNITMDDPSQDTMATAGPLQGGSAFLSSFVKSS
ncbi:MAG TPA: G1 family glutamic endopeptidase [Streptosporangiaceae bacterium]|jgi:hypothetical protein